MNCATWLHTPVRMFAESAWGKSPLCAAVLLAALSSGTGAQAAGPAGPAGPTGPVGPVGPVGTIGPTGPANAAGVAPVSPPPTLRVDPVARPAAPVRPASSADGTTRSSPARGTGNHIEVTGNTATGIRCGQDGSASVNSVDVSGARLDGRTVIVQGRNASDVRTRDCAQPTQPQAPGQGGTGQTNGIRIR